MDTKLATTQFRVREWATVIQDRIQSGQTVNEYCAQHGLSRNAYFYWLRRVKEAALTQSGFVEIKAEAESANQCKSGKDIFYPNLLITIRDVSIGISADTSMELLSQVIGAVRHAE